MTAQHDAAAEALAEVRRQQTKIRRFVGNGWFEITFVGVALLAAFGLSQLVHGTVPTVAVFAACLAPYYAAVYWRHRTVTHDLGFTSEPVWVANTISAVTAALCLTAGIALRGDAAVLTVDGIAAACCVVFAVMYRAPVLATLAVVDVGAGIFSALTSDGGWLPDLVVCGGALVVLGAVLLIRVQRER
jgi:hypothetical protein